MFKLIILICAVGAPGDECSLATAATSLRPADLYPTPIACLMDVETKLAGAPFGSDLSRWRIKALCPRAAFDVGSKH